MTFEERIVKDEILLDGLGIRCVMEREPAGAPRRWHLELRVTSARVNAADFCHGGYLFALADTACAYALADAGLHPATIDANITYLAAARLDDLVIAAVDVLHTGRSQGVAEVRLLRSTDDRLLAVYRGTCVNHHSA